MYFETGKLEIIIFFLRVEAIWKLTFLLLDLLPKDLTWFVMLNLENVKTIKNVNKLVKERNQMPRQERFSKVRIQMHMEIGS